MRQNPVYRVPTCFITAVAIVLTSMLFAGTASAVPFQPVLDEFWIVKNGPEIFRDSFNGGGLPPSGPDGAATYNVVGAGGITSEAGGKLTMTPSLGDSVIITGGFADTATAGLRLSSTNSANPNFLGASSSFSIHGLFDMSNLPQITGQSFGIRASDRATGIGNEGNDVIQLNVVKNSITGNIGANRLKTNPRALSDFFTLGLSPQSTIGLNRLISQGY